MTAPQCDDATCALAIASSDATGTNTKALPAEKLVGRWFSKPISAGIRPSAAASRSAGGRRARLLRQLGGVELGERRRARPQAHADPDRADLFLEHDQRVAVALALPPP